MKEISITEALNGFVVENRKTGEVRVARTWRHAVQMIRFILCGGEDPTWQVHEQKEEGEG